VPYRPESARTARQLVRDKLLEWGLDDLVEMAELVVSELVTNALNTGCHTAMQVTIRRRAEGYVRITVRDGSRSLPVLLAAGEDEECHRGLALVHAVTGGRWGTTLEVHGKVVHADLPAG
jgi:anti-sigma regulatory factor (Ser/Thr protein kinase)